MEIRHAKFSEFKALKNTVPSMVFDPKKETFEEWQKKAEEKLKELLGIPYEICETLFSIEYEKELEKCREIRFTFQSEEGEFVPAVMWIPKTPCCEKPPVMVCLQGHGMGMHVSFGIKKYEEEKELTEAQKRGADADPERRNRKKKKKVSGATEILRCNA